MNDKIILSRHLIENIDSKQQKNSNILILGGTSHEVQNHFIIPNLLEERLNTSFVCTDYDGEIISKVSPILKKRGYIIKILDLVNPSISNHYNPFKHIKDANDIIDMVSLLTDDNDDIYLQTATRKLLSAIIAFIWLHGEEFNLPKNINTVINILVDNSYFSYTSTISKYKEDDLAYVFYTEVKGFPEDLTKSIGISVLCKSSINWSAFNIPPIKEMMSYDDFEFDKIGDKKIAVFINVPSAHNSYNFIGAMFLSQMLKTLIKHANQDCKGSYLIYDINNELVTTIFYDESKTDEELKKEAERIILKTPLVKIIEEDELFNIYVDNVLVNGYPGKKTAEKRCAAIKSGCQAVKQNIQVLPNNVMFFINRLSNIGKIPDFDKTAMISARNGLFYFLREKTIIDVKATYPVEWKSLLGAFPISILMDESTILQLLSKLNNVKILSKKIKKNKCMVFFPDKNFCIKKKEVKIHE